MTSTMMMDRTSMGMPAMGMPGMTQATPMPATMPVGPNYMMVPRCTMKFEKTSGGMKIHCTCDDAVACNMMQNLCTMLQGGLCTCCCTLNGMTVCLCSLTMGMCSCEMTDKGCTISCTSGDAKCAAMIQACCDCLQACCDAGCCCTIMMNNTPCCCGCTTAAMGSTKGAKAR